MLPGPASLLYHPHAWAPCLRTAAMNASMFSTALDDVHPRMPGCAFMSGPLMVQPSSIAVSS
jgi:hypothetical protein